MQVACYHFPSFADGFDSAVVAVAISAVDPFSVVAVVDSADPFFYPSRGSACQSAVGLCWAA